MEHFRVLTTNTISHMKTETELFGIEVALNTPNSVADAISLAGEDRVLELLVEGAKQSNINKIKKVIVEKLEEVTGEKRKMNTEGKVTESPMGYIERLKSLFPDFATKFLELFSEAASSHSFSLVRERKAVAEAKVPKKFLTIVRYMYADKDEDGNAKASTLEIVLSKYNTGLDISDLLDDNLQLTEEGAEQAARALREPLEAKERALKAANADI